MSSAFYLIQIPKPDVVETARNLRSLAEFVGFQWLATLVGAVSSI